MAAPFPSLVLGTSPSPPPQIGSSFGHFTDNSVHNLGSFRAHGVSVAVNDGQQSSDSGVDRIEKQVNCYTSRGVKNERGLAALKRGENRLKRGELEVDYAAYACVSRLCGDAKTVSDGKRVHAQFIRSGQEREALVGNLLVQMYGKCGSLVDARAVFDGIRPRNLFSWNIMIAAYSQNSYGREALKLFEQMQVEGMEPDEFTFTPLLSACANLGDLTEGKLIHSRILAAELQANVVVGNALVNMYGKCGRLEDAFGVFDRMQQRDTGSWNALIVAYVRNEHAREGLQLFRRMELEGVKPNKITFLGVLDACGNLTSLPIARVMHARMLAAGFKGDVVLNTAAISTYGKCGSAKDAQGVFDKMYRRNVVTWNAMIAACSQNGENEEAYELFVRMGSEGIVPNRITFLGVLDACANLASLSKGRAIHSLVSASEFASDTVVETALVNMYGKCGSLEDARFVFDTIYERDGVSWNAMITACAQNGHAREALELFQSMDLEGVEPNTVTFLSVLDACANLASLATGKLIHARIIERGFVTDDMGTALVSMYGKCGSLNNAQAVFDKMRQQNVASRNAMIGAYAQNGHGKEALQLFDQMHMEGMKPDQITFIGILNTCVNLASLAKGKAFHAHILASGGFKLDDVVETALINMYGKLGSPEDARAVFDKMHQRDLVSWNAMIAAYAQNGLGKEAFELFEQMDLEEVKPDKITFLSILHACVDLRSIIKGREIHAQIVACEYESDTVVENALMNMYGRCGSLKEAQEIFGKMYHRDVASWNIMIALSMQNAQASEAFKLFHQMQLEGMEPDKITFLEILDACASLSFLVKGRDIHACIVAKGFDADIVVENALVHMYGKCGSLKDAHAVFDKMHQQDVVSWNAIIAACGQNGHGKEALKLFRQMVLKGVKPDKLTFLNILNACSHAGLLDAGWNYFVSMSRDYGIQPMVEHYGCMLDLLGRAGQLNEAEDLINSMPIQPNAVTWMILLGACQIHGDVERAARAAEHVYKLDPKAAAPYVLLSNIYATAGRWADAAMVRKVMEDAGLKKEPGCSWLEVRNRIHGFTAGDTSHPQSEEIYAELQKLSRQMEEAGYVPHVKGMLHAEEEIEKKQMHYHSEKLAIAFGLISTPFGTPLHIVKNLRVCSDCHAATKFISNIVGRDIFVRDANRFHHFKNGVCSCEDYW